MQQQYYEKLLNYFALKSHACDILNAQSKVDSFQRDFLGALGEFD